MRELIVVQVILAAGLLAGCSTSQPVRAGGTHDSSYNQAYPEPVASPSQRPGSNPQDPRDPQFNSWPNPPQTPPVSRP